MIELIDFVEDIKIFNYKGLRTSQKAGVEKAFDVLAKETEKNPFKRIIEIGTDYGGLTNLIADHPVSANVKKLFTFDINPTRFISYNSKINFINIDVFQIEKEIGDLIQKPGRTLFICDGGNKKHEFQTFQKYLKKDDVIMAHDYAPNKQVFLEKYLNKIWTSHEFEDSYADFVTLEPYLQDVFANYVWCIRIKKD